MPLNASRLRFEQQHNVLWGNLSRLNGILIVANVSLFFLTGQVTSHGYTYPIISLSLLMLVSVGLVIPSGLLDRLWYYCVFLAIEFVGFYFLLASVVYWLNANGTSPT